MPQVKPSTSLYKPEEQLPRSPTAYYNMNHKRRGLALIFNHENFDNGAPTRRGTKIDRDRLSNLFTNLGFQVETKDDPTYNDIYETIQEAAKMDHSQSDCLIITVLTHGELGRLYAKDYVYKIENLWRDFTDQRCPTLAGKPKIYIIQACRGDRFDNGMILSEQIQTDGSSGTNSYPMYPDFLFASSTPPHYYSWRNSSNGSWFIQSFCDMMEEHANKETILTWLTYVCRKVALDYESYTPDRVDSHEKKQTADIRSTLTRLLVFTDNSKTKTTGCCS